VAALCSSGGSLDWLCLPRFDGDPVFGRLIDEVHGGCFSVTPAGVTSASQRYRQDSAVLETTWETEGGKCRLTEGMVVDVSSDLRPQMLLVRRLECLEGRVAARVRFDPRRGLPGVPPRVRASLGGILCSWGDLALLLLTEPHVDIEVGCESVVQLSAGTSITFALSSAHREPMVAVPPRLAWEMLEEADAWWRGWCDQVHYQGPHRELVLRSLLVLRMLTYSPSGAPVAAPTTSLPETLGGGRNWDYRYAWPRDASIGIGAFTAIGKYEEAEAFLNWLVHASRLTRPRVETLYTLDGKPGRKQREVDGLSGYRGSLPVRVGNQATDQHQLDVYGWVLDGAWALVRLGRKLNGEQWRALAAFGDFIAEHWSEPDSGIWEVPGPRRHYVHSKLMAWLGLDRALRIAEMHRTSKRRLSRWQAQRELLGQELRQRGYDAERGTFVRAYDSLELDAAVLLPVLDFEDPGSAMVRGTVRAVQQRLSAGGPLLHRYPVGSDGLDGREGAFLACSFWLVRALAQVGEISEAHSLFHQLCEKATAPGLFGEQMDPATDQHLGNFPQALTHAALVQAALSLQGVVKHEGTPPG
jgi:GH15 family glucan-1,4-alpha-glucosidase